MLTIKQFFCNNDQCQCYQNHQTCSKLHIKNVIKKISDKLYRNINQLKDDVKEIFTNLTNRIIQIQQQIQSNIQNQVKFVQTTKIQQQFYQYFMDEKIQNAKQFNGSKLAQMLDILNSQQSHKKVSQEQIQQKYLHQLKYYQQISLQTVTKTRQSLDKIVQLIRQQTKPQNWKQYQIQIDQILFPRPGHSSLCEPLSMILYEQHLQKLMNFFPKKIKSMFLVFKASQNNFQMKKFYQQCGHMNNLIIICQTEKNKLIGGYTPLSFNPINLQKNEWVGDNGKSSFIFSLTHNDKFQLKQHQYALCRVVNRLCIQFGYGGSLYIADMADKNSESQTGLGYDTYLNGKYANNQDGYERFNGNKGKNFKLKEWMGLKVEFQ